MKRRIAFLAAVFGLLMTTAAYAGDINGNEQRIVSVIYGQFEQNGILYEVQQEYIDAALDYLTRDDMDLTVEQADYVIDEIYSNIQTGVESGYLREVGRVQATASPQEVPNQEQTSAEISGEDITDETEGEADPGLADPSEEPPSETSLSEETAASQQPGQTAAAPIAISALKAAQTIPQTYDQVRRDTDQRMEGLHIPSDMYLAVIAFCGAATVVCLLIALWIKFLSAHHRHRLRVAVRIVSGIAGAAEIYLLFLMIALWIGAFQDSSVLNRISDTEYYRAIYDELRGDTGMSLSLMNIPDSVMDDSITYERVVMAARQQLENDLRNGDYKADTSILTDQLQEDISAYLETRSAAVTDQIRAGIRILTDRLGEKYENLLRWPFSSWWHDLSVQFGQIAEKSVPILCALIFLCILIQYILGHHLGHSISNISRILFAGAGIVLLTGIVFRFKGLSGWETITPPYMGQFFGMYRAAVARAFMGVGGCGILLSAAFRLGADTLKKTKKH